MTIVQAQFISELISILNTEVQINSDLYKNYKSAQDDLRNAIINDEDEFTILLHRDQKEICRKYLSISVMKSEAIQKMIDGIDKIWE